MKNIPAFFIAVCIACVVCRPVLALDQARPNNIHGIHLAQPSDEDIQNAARLVNSSGGDWGYVTLVIQENDRDKGKWQSVFNSLREKRLIPIVRIATNPEGANWRRPNIEDAVSWANFLDSLHWVVKDRYIVLFNETNHATEWGGAVDPVSFADISKRFAEELKRRNSDYFIMLGGLDASAPSSLPNYESEDVYLTQVVSHMGDETFENLFDGLSSHSYPNPAFAGSPAAQGRGTVRTYEWELSLLKSLGIEKEMPVFITETGWSSNSVSRDVIGSYLRDVYENVWEQDRRVRAVTPFILNYQSEPFLQFSWQQPGGTYFYPQYTEAQALSKTKGSPEQVEQIRFRIDLPKELTVESEFHFQFTVQNVGQSIWDRDEGYKIAFAESFPGEYFFSDLRRVRPFDEAVVDVYLKTDKSLGKQSVPIVLFHGEEQIGKDVLWTYEKVPWPSLTFNAVLYPKLRTVGDDFTFQVFDGNEDLVFEQKRVGVANGKATVHNIQNIALGPRYRAVLLKRYYLPRQTFVRFRKENNEIKFPFMIPLDFYPDGHLDTQDIVALVQNPSLASLLFP